MASGGNYGYILNAAAYEEFEELWKLYYPDEIKWYKLASIAYDNVQSIFMDGKNIFVISPQPQHDYALDRLELAEWLTGAVKEAIESLQAGTYNRFLLEKLPYRKRLGRILRRDYWSIDPEFREAHLKGISPADIQRFAERIKKQPQDTPAARLSQMTAGFFFECCKIGYAANHYNDADTKSAKELYIQYSDGRHEGLLDLDESSAEEFDAWFHDRSRYGGHPWEVCRGGNSTHVSMYVFRDEKGWGLKLKGSSWGRSVETVNFYMALSDRGYPVALYDGPGLANMLTGTDYIGIVPEGTRPVYCESLFPDRDMLDFMNLPPEEDKKDQVVAAAEWYPPDPVRLV